MVRRCSLTLSSPAALPPPASLTRFSLSPRKKLWPYFAHGRPHGKGSRLAGTGWEKLKLWEERGWNTQLFQNLMLARYFTISFWHRSSFIRRYGRPNGVTSFWIFLYFFFFIYLIAKLCQTEVITVFVVTTPASSVEGTVVQNSIFQFSNPLHTPYLGI